MNFKLLSATALTLAVLAPAPAEAFWGKKTTLKAGRLEITNIRVQKVRNSSARSGYVFKFTGDLKNNGEELTRTGSVGASVGACMFGKVKDDKKRSFEVSCNVKAALPGEVIKGGFTAQSSAMPDSTKAKLCTGWLKCTSLLPLN